MLLRVFIYHSEEINCHSEGIDLLLPGNLSSLGPINISSNILTDSLCFSMLPHHERYRIKPNGFFVFC